MHERAGQPANATDLIDLAALKEAYYRPIDPANGAQKVSFGTSGHRGSALNGSFNEPHIAAICLAIAEYRAGQGITGPLFLGGDPHPLSEPALQTAQEVLLAAGVDLRVSKGGEYVPTPAVSHAILRHNAAVHADAVAAAEKGDQDGAAAALQLADGIIVTPSHNPPADGGIKYNPPHAGPADTDATGAIAARANELLQLAGGQVPGVELLRGEKGSEAAGADGAVAEAKVAETGSASNAATGEKSGQTGAVTGSATCTTTGSITEHDFVAEYVQNLAEVIDIKAIREAGVRFAAHPLGGASVAYWQAIADIHGREIDVLGPGIDKQWAFMSLDWDGKIRMDPSSSHAMQTVLTHQSSYDLIVANDADADRHGIVTRDGGLMNPNHFLAVAIDYLLTHRPSWPRLAGVGKTIVSSAMIDRVVASHERTLLEVPVGFKWFVAGLHSGRIAFGGEESAGASLLTFDGRAWSTDKDGIALCLLAAEILAVTGKTPSEYYRDLTEKFGDPAYARVDAAASDEQKARLLQLQPSDIDASELAGEKISEILTHAPGNDAAIGGLVIRTENAWAAIRPSGTEAVMKVYAESFLGAEHLARVQADTQAILAKLLQ
ncbi:MAG: phosphoglucomutase [Microbacteriaceae bacterium]|nr:phosphoglucomutase [Microbacteriaceae bacterium]